MSSTSKLILDTCQTILKKLEDLEERQKKLEAAIITSKARSSPSTKSKTTKKAKIEKSGKVTINNYHDGLLITGDTYDKRVILKKYKSLWNKDKKGWYVKKDYYDEIKKSLEECSLSLNENDVDEYYFEKPDNAINNDSRSVSEGEGSVNSSFNPSGKYEFLSDDED